MNVFYLDKDPIIAAQMSCVKLFVNVLFNHNTAFLSNDNDKHLFRSNSAAFIIASRTVYARMKCEQTTEFELLKLLQ